MPKDLNECKVSEQARIVDGMRALDRSALHIVLVVDHDERVIGTLTDGDVRRALLGGATLETCLAPFVQRNFTWVLPEISRTEVIELMQARTIEQVPILDAQRRLVGLHLLHDLVGASPRPNWAVIMAGGKGTRLEEITRHTPKPMVPVAGRPILERLILHLVGFGFRKIYLSVNYLSHIIENHFGSGEQFGCEICYLREEAPLGTGGSLSLLPEPPQHPLLVLNGDLVTQADVDALLRFHDYGEYRCTVALKRYTHTIPYGTAIVEGDLLKGFHEKPTLSYLINAGMYVLDPELVARVPKGAEFHITSLIEGAVDRGERVGGFEIVGDWIDVGLREQLRIAREGAA